MITRLDCVSMCVNDGNFSSSFRRSRTREHAKIAREVKQGAKLVQSFDSKSFAVNDCFKFLKYSRLKYSNYVMVFF